MNWLPVWGITNGALTSHVKKLEETGILAILPEHSGHGNQKVCRINVDKILVDVATNNEVRLRTVILLIFRSAIILITLFIRPAVFPLPRT